MTDDRLAVRAERDQELKDLLVEAHPEWEGFTAEEIGRIFRQELRRVLGQCTCGGGD